MKITGYEALCNLGNDIDSIYKNAINGNNNCFKSLDGYIKEGAIRVGLIDEKLPEIEDKNFNLRCNKVLLKNIELMQNKIDKLLNDYPKDKIGVIVATTNSGVEEFETSENQNHYELGNPAYFLKVNLGLKGFCTTVSTACSSGIKAFSLARDLINDGVCDAVIIACIDTLAKVPIYGFHSLEVLSNKPSIPFSKNRAGMNMGEASAIFIIEKDAKTGIDIMGIGESSDIYHSTTPDPEAVEVIKAMNIALEDANIKPEDIDYINAHGTGTAANDLMEANAINKIFKDKTPVSSTKSMTGHCLGAAAGIETALCCKLLEKFDGRLLPHIYDNEYDPSLPQIKLAKKGEQYNKCKICMCNSFGFGGTNAILILGSKNE